MLRNILFIVATAAMATAAGISRRADTVKLSERCPKGMLGDYRISQDNKLFASCRKENTEEKAGAFVWSELNLGQCFANDNGIVNPRIKGNMQQTCMKCEFQYKTSNMICSCPNKDWEWIESENELNDNLWVNPDGMVCCKDSDECAVPFDYDEYHVPEPKPVKVDNPKLTPTKQRRDMKV